METARARRTAGRYRPGRRPVAGRAPRTLILVGAAVALAAVLAEASVTGRPWLPPGAVGWGLLALAAALAVPSVLPGHGTARVTGAVAPLSLAGLLLHGPSAALLLALPLVLAPVAHRGRRLFAVLRAACEVTALAVAAGAVALAGLLPPGSGPWTPEQWWSAAVPALLVGGTAHLVLRGVLVDRCLPPTVGPVGPARPAPAAAALLAAAPLIVVVATHAPVLLPLFAPALGALDAALRSARARATDRLLDPLTGLPNRRWLVQRTRDALVEVERTDGRCALVLIDVDRFRSVNDTLGHGTGDRLLLEIAERVERAAPAGAETARLGADEFAVLLPTIPSVGAAHRAAREVVRAIEAPVELDGLTVVVEASAGVAVYPDHAAPRADGGRGAPAGAPPCPRPPAPPRSLPGEAGRPRPVLPEGLAATPGAPSAEQPSAPLRPRLPVRAAHRGEGSVRDLPTSPAGRRGATVPPPAGPPACGPAGPAEPPGRADRHSDTPVPPRPTVPPPPTVPPAAARPAPATPSGAGGAPPGATPPPAPRDRSPDRAEPPASARDRSSPAPCPRRPRPAAPPGQPRPERRPRRAAPTGATAEDPPGARAAEALLRQADVALSEAKRSGRPAVEVYDRSRDRHTPGRLALLGDLRAALDTGQVRLHYQPKVRFDGTVAGLEALVRWDHPERGRVAPDEFIAVAESSGLMPRLTDYVLEAALAQVARWRTDGIAVPVAVNVSPRDVHTPGFAGAVAARLARHGVPAGALQLEITEHVLLDDPQQAADTLAGLTGHGVRMSLDDFGTGYSSLVHLRRLPVSELKIDRAFVARLAEDGEDAEIVRCTVELAHSLGLAVVAEGVEDGETWNRLRDLGCDAVQGWLLSPAMPAAQTTRWLRDHHRPGAGAAAVAGHGPAAPGPAREPQRQREDPARPAS